jgi:ribonucleoside-diphosphate reductase alpha chain
MWHRVASHLATNDREYSAFAEVMSTLKFLPNSPCLVNAGNPLGQLAACFVIPIEDSIDGIMGSAHLAAKIHQTGGGTGFDFSRIREAGSIVRSTGNVASGPVSFLDIFDVTTGAIKQGGVRRGANMGILRVDHPDILAFIDAKRHREEGTGLLRTPGREANFVAAPRRWTNFNVSVAITQEFIDALTKGGDYPLVSPTGRKVSMASAPQVWDRIIQGAWDTGDPGLFFVDRVNQVDMVPGLGRITATNPCGEVPLRDYETCNLGSINLSKFILYGAVDWPELERVVRIAVRFLNRVIDKNVYPDPRIQRATEDGRKIGIGVMGFADALILMGIKYDSPAGIGMAERFSKAINEAAEEESIRMAEEEGSFPAHGISKFSRPMRNSSRTVIAPTGTISLIADCSSGIEPLFAVEYWKNVMDTKLRVTHPLWDMVPPEKRDTLFRVANQVPTEYHVMMQAAWQANVNDGISKTINMPNSATPDDIREAYEFAIKMGVKGLTVFRDGCLTTGQVLDAMQDCPDCGTALVHKEGCESCPNCGLEMCSAV